MIGKIGRFYLCIMYSPKDKGMTIMNHAETEPEEIRRLDRSRALDVAEFQERNLCRWILGKLIVNHRSINYVVYPIKIMIFHWWWLWQWINDQCTWRWRFWLTSNTDGSLPYDYFNLEVMKPCFCMSSCLKQKCHWQLQWHSECSRDSKIVKWQLLNRQSPSRYSPALAFKLRVLQHLTWRSYLWY